MSGAMAMIGIVWLATMIGTSARSSDPHVDEDDRQRETEERPEREPDGRVPQREHGRAETGAPASSHRPRRAGRTPARCPTCAAASKSVANENVSGGS